LAMAGKLVAAPVIVFASEHAAPAKVDAMRALRAEVRLVPGGYGEAEQAGLDYAHQNGGTWISPYNDGQVIAGQGTLGLEILRQWPDLRPPTWVVPAGGGGLASGIGAAMHNRSPHGSKLVAVSSEASPFLHGLYHTNSQEGILEEPSLADGLAGPVEPGSITISMVKKYVDDFILVTEEEIRHAIAEAWQRYHERIEGSAAVALAAVLYGKISARPAIIILTGGNIQPEIFQELVPEK
jgi:threonine dehydratase